NTLPFRASSHFLYLFGAPLRGAHGLWDGTSWTLYVPAPATDDPLWHGPEPSLTELQTILGCPVRPTDDLPRALAGLKVATIPAVDLETCLVQSALVGREVRPGVLEPVDIPLADALIALRLIHDDHAVGELRAAAAATAAAHRAGMKATRPGLRESNVRAAMEAELIARGMTVAYGSIVTVHGEVLHSYQHHHLLGDGDLLLADVGAETAGGWAGDVTRTWPVRGRYSPTQKDLYDVVLAAQQETIRAVKPGARYRDLHLLASRRLAEGLVALGVLVGDPDELVADGVTALLFPHGVGHLLGLDVHDMEDLGDRAGYQPGRNRAQDFGIRYLRLDRDLAPGMALTIEPGLYIVPAILEDPELAKRANGRLRRDRLAGFSDVRGIRIEDDVLVTAAGNEVLTAAIPKTRDAVESEMR
ncbi:MAG TPA: aminopeptidase P N-terminal domain-containing protein, partial [Polyangia bacterium]|nr:aminopeptidase P N-terminal domain-containing protein [Polyangia bacterium]